MALPDALIAWAIRFSSTTYVIRVVVNSVTEDLTFPTSGSTLDTTTDYFMTGDEDSVDLCELLETCIEQHSEVTTAAVTIDSNFLVEVDVAAGGGSTIDLQWDHGNTTLDGTVWGFTATTGNDDPAVSDTLPQGLWRPTRPIGIDSRDRQPLMGGVSSSVQGDTRVASFGTPYKEREITFVVMPQAKVLTEYAASSEPTGAFEYAWVNSIGLGRTFRLYADETDISTGSSAYTIYTTRELADPMERSQQYNVFWEVMLKMRKTA